MPLDLSVQPSEVEKWIPATQTPHQQLFHTVLQHVEPPPSFQQQSLDDDDGTLNLDYELEQWTGQKIEYSGCY